MLNNRIGPDQNLRNTGGSVDRTFQLLHVLTVGGRAMTLAELADRLTLPKTTVHRLCARLIDSGHLMREVDERYYAVGPALRQLAFDTLTHGSNNRLRHNVLSDLVDEIGETCNFTTLDGASVLYLDRVETQRPWRLTLSVGVNVPLHCTASGKLFMSQMEAGARAMLLAKMSLAELTSNTITNPDELEEEMNATLERGYAVDMEEFVTGLIAIAVPVLDRGGKARAAIAMHCPTTYVTIEQAALKLPALRRAAERIGQLLDCDGWGKSSCWS